MVPLVVYASDKPPKISLPLVRDVPTDARSRSEITYMSPKKETEKPGSTNSGELRWNERFEIVSFCKSQNRIVESEPHEMREG